MNYVLYILMVAVIFGIIALADFVLGKVFRKSRALKQGKSVRMPRYSLILGLLMAILGFFCLLYIPYGAETFLWYGCLLVVVIGVYLLVNFSRFGIFYDDEQFTYRTLTKKAKTYRYSEIRSQRTFTAKSGLNITLDAAGDEIQLYTAMQGLGDFLSKAFYRWCLEKGLDPETTPHDPSMLVYFPSPEEEHE